MSTQLSQSKRIQPIDISRLFYYILKSLKKLWWLILLLALLFGGLNDLRAELSYQPIYQSSASYTVEIDDVYSTYYERIIARQLAASFPYILTTGELTALVCKDLGVSSLPGTLSVSVMENTNLLTVSARSTSAETAYDILCSVVKNYPSVAEYVVGKTNLKLVISPAVPAESINEPDRVGNVKKGMLIGGALGLLLIAVRALLTSTILDTEDAKKQLNCPNCSALPMVHYGKKQANTVLCIKDQAINTGFYESVSALRNSVVHQARKKDAKTIMVTSTVSGEGKTTVAVNLAYSLSNHAYRVLLIDCDLRNPSVMNALGYTECKTPFSQVIKGKASLEDALVHENECLDILMEERFNSDASELVGSPLITSLLAELRDSYDYIIVDTPPCGLVSESLILAEHIDGLLYVIRQDYVRTAQIMSELERYMDSGIKLLGCVLNRTKRVDSAGSKRYGVYGAYGNYNSYGYGKQSR